MRAWLCLLSLVSASAYAAESVRSVDFTIHQEYASTRALGMGNAFTAVADDHSALFYNPATLALRKDGQLRMFVRAGTDSESLKLFDELDKADQQTDKDQAYADLLVDHYGDHFYYRVPTVGAVWVKPRWGFAFIPADLSMDIAAHRQVGPALNVNGYLDSTLAVGHARELHWLPKEHTLAWGVTLKAIHRVYIGEAINAGQLADGSDIWDTSHAREGLTGDIDFGTLWKPPVPKTGFFKFLKYMAPSFAVVGRNLVDYGFKQNFHLVDDNSGEPPPLQRRFDFGTKWDLPKFWKFDPHFSFDIRDVGHENWSLTKGTHAGMELYWKMFNWWKGHWAFGLNQGYWTAGFGARLAWFQIDVASFGEEVGSDSTPQESRRYMLELALDF